TNFWRDIQKSSLTSFARFFRLAMLALFATNYFSIKSYAKKTDESQKHYRHDEDSGIFWIRSHLRDVRASRAGLVPVPSYPPAQEAPFRIWHDKLLRISL